MPSWAALPSLLSTVALMTALFGMYWDISLHIDDGRDPGPLANPAHYFILVGLFGIFAAGVIAIALPEERPSRVAVKIAPGWYAPLGGIVLMVPRRRSRARRLPARRRLAPPLRPGRDALGPDPPDADRRRRPDAARPGDPAGRGRRQGRRPGRAREQGRRLRLRRPHAAGRGLRRPADRAVHLPGRVRLRRAAVPAGLPARADRLRRRRRAGRRAHLHRPRRRARGGRLLLRDPRHRVAAGGPGARRDAAAPAALHRRGGGRRAGGAALRPDRPYALGALAGLGSARSALPPSGAGRTSGCRTRGRPPCSARPCRWCRSRPSPPA